MERIDVSDSWRVTHTDSFFKLEFTEKADIDKALEAIKKVVTEINYENGYGNLWIQDLSDKRTDTGFDIQSTLWSDEFARYIPAMIKAIAETLPDKPFRGSAKHDSLKCFYVDEYEFCFDGNRLRIRETFMDDENGYFCPECGSFIAYPNEKPESDTVECEDCEEIIRTENLVYVAPIITEEEIVIK